MMTNQCWSRQCDGGRCEEPAAPGTNFCVGHGSRAGGVNPLAIWRAPEAEMPPDLVATIRRYVPDVTFPPATPEAPPPAATQPVRQAEQPPSEFISVPISSPPCPSVSPPGPGPTPSAPPLRVEADPMAWLMAILQDAMTGMMASDATPLQKANAVARLAGHYLKAYRASELEKENKELAKRAADLEQRALAAEARASDRVCDETSSAPDCGRQPQRGNPIRLARTLSFPDFAAARSPGGVSVLPVNKKIK